MKTRKISLISGLALILSFLGMPAIADVASGALFTNVKSFGAKGDGNTDDTEAIQAAFDSTSKGKTVVPAGDSVFASVSTVFFPSGHYKVSKQINLDGICNVAGEPNAVIQQTVKDSDIFVTKGALFMNISGLSFIGGKSQINFYNPNIAGGVVTIEQCKFADSSDFAVKCDFESTNLRMENCSLLKCIRGIFLKRIDVVTIRDGWWVNHPDMKNCAFVENRAQRVYIENICANPFTNGFDQRWIDNYSGNLTLKHMRFGGEGGGFTPVVHFSKPGNSTGGSSVLIEDSWCCNTSNIKRDSILYCEEIPNSIIIRNNPTVTSRNLIQIRPDIDLKTYFVKNKIASSLLHFEVSGNLGGGILDSVPELLKTPVADKSYQLSPIDECEKKKLIEMAAADWNKNKVPGQDNGISKSNPSRHFCDHVQKTDANDYVDINSSGAVWEATDDIDAINTKASEFLSFKQVDSDTLMIWTREGELWPHFNVRKINVDLSVTPILTLKTIKGNKPAPTGFLYRVYAPSKGICVTLDNTEYDDYKYLAWDIEKLLEISGKQELELRIYPMPWGWTEKALKNKNYDTQDPTAMYKAEAGSYAVFDFVRFEKR